jgi:hypothetical protein
VKAIVKVKEKVTVKKVKLKVKAIVIVKEKVTVKEVKFEKRVKSEKESTKRKK